MHESTLTDLALVFLALSDKTRLRLLELMADGEVSVGFLADQLGESQPKISRHLAYLRSAGLVASRRDGKWVHYRIADQTDACVRRVLNAMLGPIFGDERVLENNISAEPYIDDWAPAEMEIYLL